jgi:hypothetical protein
MRKRRLEAGRGGHLARRKVGDYGGDGVHGLHGLHGLIRPFFERPFLGGALDGRGGFALVVDALEVTFAAGVARNEAVALHGG